jgi:hypothetical protein
MVPSAMSAMKSGDFQAGFPCPGRVPGRGSEPGGLACLHAGQPGEDVGEIGADVDPKAAAVLHEGVEDGAFAAGFFVSGSPR